MNHSKEFKRQLEFHRERVLNVFKSTARLFETYEVAAEVEDTVKFADGHDDQDEPQIAQEVELDGTIVIFHQGNEVMKLKPEDCETGFLLDVLESLEKTLEELYNEKFA